MSIIPLKEEIKPLSKEVLVSQIIFYTTEYLPAFIENGEYEGKEVLYHAIAEIRSMLDDLEK